MQSNERSGWMNEKTTGKSTYPGNSRNAEKNAFARRLYKTSGTDDEGR